MGLKDLLSLKALTNWKNNAGTVWLWIGITLLACNFAFVGMARWEFTYGLVYSLGFIALGAVLTIRNPTMLGGITAGLIGLIAVALTMNLLAMLTPTIAMMLAIVLFAAFVLAESKIIPHGGTPPAAKYAVMLALGAEVLFPFLYFYGRLFVSNLPLPMETIAYHGGIMLLAGMDFFTGIGAVKFKYRNELRIVFALMTIIGALLLTGVKHWGLNLV